uniref:Uncharacterized protein, contains caspase domain n=1 Tax=Candidatus Kentrum sp. FW TaxID=2126338 RepID=A0A450TCE9_9GAMM|nr:MAG: Uncharacterized protein, contains caspase domain [Candidatus Kentron sp. FW]
MLQPLLFQKSPSFRRLLFLLPAITLGCQSANLSATPSAPSANLSPCSFDKTVEQPDGHRRLALIVGVGEYKNPDVPDLEGSPNDAKDFYELLTGKDGYGFPKENVCLLTNEQATQAAVEKAFQKGLIERARKEKNDVAVFFYAGHGSQMKDQNGDEPDGCDETFLFHDARTNGVTDFRDDDFNGLLAKLHDKTDQITVILDSCNAGTATRAADAGTYVARLANSADGASCKAGQGNGTDKGKVLKDLSKGLPGAVIFTAASDGTSALERSGKGVFTTALLEVLRGVGNQPLTYAQVARQVPPLVKAESYQIPYFQGDLNRVVFGNETRNRPVGWEVTEIEGEEIHLSGPPLPGIGRNAELRVYDGAVTGADSRDPAKAKATVVMNSDTKLGAVNGLSRISSKGKGKPDIKIGDLAILATPSDDALKISVRLRPAGEKGGIEKQRADALRKAIENDTEAKMLVTVTEGPGDFELRVEKNKLVLYGPENRLRTTFKKDSGAPKNLWQHARQRSLLKLKAEGGGDFTDNETLKVRLVPAKTDWKNKEHPCASIDVGEWKQAKHNSEQIIPECHKWNVEVTYVKAADKDLQPPPLLIGGLILSSDGAVFGFPRDGRAELLKPGETVKFDKKFKVRGRLKTETFRGAEPFDVQDHVLVFGTQEENPVGWHLLTEDARVRSVGRAMGGLHRELDRYVGKTRGVGDEEIISSMDITTWTKSSVTMRVIKANK